MLFNNACVGIPAVCVNCFLIWIAVSVLLNLAVPQFTVRLFGLNPDEAESIFIARMAAVIGIIMLACYFIFMYPDAQSIANGTSACSSTIYPLGGN